MPPDGCLGERPGRVLEGVPGDRGRAVHPGDSCRGGSLPADRGRLGISSTLHDDAQVAGSGRVWQVRSGVGAPVETAEVDAVLDAGGLAVRGEPVPAAGAVVQAVVGVGTHQVKRDGLRCRGRRPGERAVGGDGRDHLEMPVALAGMVEPAERRCVTGRGRGTDADPHAGQRQQGGHPENRIAARQEFVSGVEQRPVGQSGGQHVRQCPARDMRQRGGPRAGADLTAWRYTWDEGEDSWLRLRSVQRGERDRQRYRLPLSSRHVHGDEARLGARSARATGRAVT